MSPVLVRVQGALIPVSRGTTLAQVARDLRARGLVLSPYRVGPTLDTRRAPAPTPPPAE
jgi:hypothetical protein